MESSLQLKWKRAWRPWRPPILGESVTEWNWEETEWRSGEKDLLTQFNAGYPQGPDIHFAIILPLIHCQDHLRSHPGRIVRRERLITCQGPATSIPDIQVTFSTHHHSPSPVWGAHEGVGRCHNRCGAKVPQLHQAWLWKQDISSLHIPTKRKVWGWDMCASRS